MVTWLELGSTTTRERWDEGGSHNHPMLGGGLVWFYRQLAGMQADPGRPGYRHIIFRPLVVDTMEFVTYTNLTSYGEAGITWRNRSGSLQMEITVPVGCEATVHVPATGPEEVIEGEWVIGEAEGVRFLEMSGDRAVFRMGSGRYSFEVNP